MSHLRTLRLDWRGQWRGPSGGRGEMEPSEIRLV